MDVVPPKQVHARCVLQRFVRQYQATRSRCNLARLEKAFDKASARCYYHPPVDTTCSVLDPAELIEKRQHLVRKYSASCVRPPSPVYSGDTLVVKSTWNEDTQEQPAATSHSSGDSDVEATREPQQATFEIVVQRLYAQLELSRDDITAKDQRIHELEDLVKLLMAQNECLKQELNECRHVSNQENNHQREAQTRLVD